MNMKANGLLQKGLQRRQYQNYVWGIISSKGRSAHPKSHIYLSQAHKNKKLA